MKVYAIIVTYNPDIFKLEKSIRRILKEVNGIIICNNSKEKMDIDIEKVEVIELGTNLGIAKAQSIGMEKAFKKYNVDFIVQFDQDSLMDQGMIEGLIKIYYENLKKGNLLMIGPQEYDIDTKKEDRIMFFNKKKIKGNKDLIYVNTIISSGCLISKEIYNVNGKMLDDWFIDIVDFEYCWRAKKNGIRTCKAKKIKLAHKLGNGKIKTRIGLKVNIGAPIRHYYQYRNTLYALKESYVPIKWKISSLIKLLIKLLTYRFILDDGKERMNFMIYGIRDFYLNKKGKYESKVDK